MRLLVESRSLTADMPEAPFETLDMPGLSYVCAGAELANSIAFGKKRWRVVTSEGVVINTSGTMEGGGKPQRGRMSAQQAQGARASAGAPPPVARACARPQPRRRQLRRGRGSRTHLAIGRLSGRREN